MGEALPAVLLLPGRHDLSIHGLISQAAGPASTILKKLATAGLPRWRGTQPPAILLLLGRHDLSICSPSSQASCGPGTMQMPRTFATRCNAQRSYAQRTIAPAK